MIVVKRISTNQKSDIWHSFRRLSHTRSSEIHALFKGNYYKQLIKNIGYQQRMELKNSVNNLSYNIKRKKLDSHENKNPYLQKIFERGHRGERELKYRLFPRDYVNGLVSYKSILNSYYEMYLNTGKYNIRISVSPDVIFIFNYDNIIKKIPCEIKTRSNGDELWDLNNKNHMTNIRKAIYQLLCQCLCVNSTYGFIFRINYNNNNPFYGGTLQLFKVNFRMDIKGHFILALKQFVENPEMDTPSIFKSNFYRIEEESIYIPPKSGITDKFLFNFYNKLII